MLPLHLKANESYDKYVQPKLFKSGRQLITFASLASENNILNRIFVLEELKSTTTYLYQFT